MHTPALRLPKMMIGFVVRRCTVDLGRAPTPAEFAAWANSGGGREIHLFGRPISDAEAHLILRHQARLVSARSASAEEQFVDDALALPGSNVVRLDEMRARRAARQR
jgi:hypothetical protein